MLWLYYKYMSTAKMSFILGSLININQFLIVIYICDKVADLLALAEISVMLTDFDQAF